jgi:glycosyltransferase involved in cell wall biosynthesis
VKLLNFISFFAIGGTERQAVTLTLGLDSARFEPHVACFRRYGDLLETIESSGIPLEEYPIDCLYNYNTLRQQLKLARYIRRHGIQIVHTYGFYANVFAVPAARLAGVPAVVASIRDMGDMYRPMQNRVQKWISPLADCVLANAEAVRQRLIAEGYRPEKIAVIPNGIAVSRFQNGRGDATLRHEFRLAPHAPLVAVLCRLNQLKGVEYFLEAAAMVAWDFPRAHFLIVGDDPCNQDGPYKKQLQNHAARLGLGRRVTFTGLRRDVPAVLSEITVSVLPSLSEGLSNVLLESMAAGVPVVATRVGGNGEAVEEGVTGFLTPPRDPAALAHAICRLLGDPELAERFGRAGQQRIAERFSLEHIVGETARLYLHLLHHGRRTAAGRARAAALRAEPVQSFAGPKARATSFTF